MDYLDWLVVDFLLGNGDLQVFMGDVLCFEWTFIFSAE